MHTTMVQITDVDLARESRAITRDFTCHHNGDYSGDVIVIENVAGQLVESVVPFDVMKELVGQYLQAEHISKIEGMPGTKFLDQM